MMRSREDLIVILIFRNDYIFFWLPDNIGKIWKNCLTRRETTEFGVNLLRALDY